jgi:hypothetical protein
MESSKPDIIDPQAAPITYVDAILAISPRPVANLVLGTWHQEALPDGSVETVHVVAARLRFDMDFAKQLRDALDQLILAQGG